MVRPGEDDGEAVDRAFADLVAGYHLTAERPEPSLPVAPDHIPADAQPLFYFSPPEPEAEPVEVEERYVPEPLLPVSKPAWPVLGAWLGMGYAVLVVLAVVVGLRLPAWAGWLAAVGFVVGFGVLVARLPRQRPPDAGDGAVL